MAASNFAIDLLGPIDTRPFCYGNADWRTWKITYRPPAGYRVRILRAQGDLVSWVRNAPEGTGAGVLLGLQTTAPEGSVRCDWCADGTFLYVQDSVSTRVDHTRTPFNVDTRAGGLLERDNILVVKIAAWLNDTSQPVHSEVSMTLTYRWEIEKQ
jgi:hypothetical protein